MTTNKIEEIARETLDRHDNDVTKATTVMVQHVLGHPELFEELMRPLVRVACYDMLRKLRRDDRAHIWTPGRETGNGVAALAADNIASLLDFPLPVAGMIPLRFATKDQVNEAWHWYDHSSRNMAAKADWLKEVYFAMGDDTTVEDSFTEEKLRELQKSALARNGFVMESAGNGQDRSGGPASTASQDTRAN